MLRINEHIEKALFNEYSGSEKKMTVLLDDGNKYLLKMPDPTREKIIRFRILTMQFQNI